MKTVIIAVAIILITSCSKDFKVDPDYFSGFGTISYFNNKMKADILIRGLGNSFSTTDTYFSKLVWPT